MIDRYGARIYGRYGFLDSFNPSFTYTDVRPEAGSVDPKTGWVARDHLEEAPRLDLRLLLDRDAPVREEVADRAQVAHLQEDTHRLRGRLG